MINPSYKYVGAELVYDWTWGAVWGYNFGVSSSLAYDETAYTIEEYLERYTAWLAGEYQKDGYSESEANYIVDLMVASSEKMRK